VFSFLGDGTMKIHPDVLAAHAEFGGDLESMQRCYEWYDLKTEITSLRSSLKESREENDRLKGERDESSRAWRDSFDSMHQRAMKAEALIRELVAALHNMAKQKTSEEIPNDMHDDLDWMGGHDAFVKLARDTLAKAKAAGYEP
jgi:predicted nuclease with TOPRIM domain